MSRGGSPAARTQPEPGSAIEVVALIGNPNSGKTTLFNALTDSHGRVANYPGVTVEHSEAVVDLRPKATSAAARDPDNARRGDAAKARLVDLPGTYSLVPRAEDEAVALDGLLGRLRDTPRPSLVIAVVDATNLERNLYLVALLRELGLPLVVALTMMDTVEADGTKVDVARLEERIGAPVIAVAAARGQGLEALREAIRGRAAMKNLAPLPSPLAATPEIESLGRAAARELGLPGDATSIGLWALSLPSSGAARAEFSPALQAQLEPLRGSPLVERSVAARYARIGEWLAQVVQRSSPTEQTRSEQLTSRIDAIALHRVLGPLVLVLIFGGLFQALFSWSKPVMDGISDGMHWVGAHLAQLLPAKFVLLRSLLENGVIAGVGNVVAFVPQIVVLFLFLGLLEDSGYLARAAFLLDRVLSRVGLHGRAFVPMLSGFACAVPAILAARTIENRRDRLVTILVTPLISCSARLPVYGLMIATVFATRPLVFGFLQTGAVVMIAMYSLSIAAALGMAAIFKRTLLKTEPSPFVLELPPYRRPRLGALARHVWSRVSRFLLDAGTVILAITVLLWGLFTFPRSSQIEAQYEAAKVQLAASTASAAPEQRDEQEAAMEAKFAQRRLEHSIAGRAGHFIEPALRPFGWDWKVGVGIIASFAAREVLVSTLGLVYGLGQGAEEHTSSLQDAMRADRDALGKPVHTPLSGLSLMVFFVLAMQCASTLATVRRETGSWRWPAFQFAYMLVLALAASFAVYQGGRLLGFS